MGSSLDEHLHLPGLPKQFALLADAHLTVEGELVPVHKALLAVASPVFADVFAAATKPNQPNEADSVPLPGHTLTDVCSILRFLYKRACVPSADTPGNMLWKSVEGARPIIQFAYKFDMQSVLQDIDACLCAKATADSKGIFTGVHTTVAWAILAEEHGLKCLLAHAELFMVKNADPAFWQSPALHKLSSSCMLRMLQAAQLNMNDWSSKFVPGVSQNKQWAKASCQLCCCSVWCSDCSKFRHSDVKPEGAHVSLPLLISWQQSGKDADTA